LHLFISDAVPLGMEVGIGPGDIVLDGDPAPPTERGTATPHFSSHVYRSYCGQTVADLSKCWAIVRLNSRHGHDGLNTAVQQTQKHIQTDNEQNTMLVDSLRTAKDFCVFLVRGQVTIIFVVSVCLSVCLCRVFLIRLWSDFDQTRTHGICLGLVVSSRI